MKQHVAQLHLNVNGPRRFPAVAVPVFADIGGHALTSENHLERTTPDARLVEVQVEIEDAPVARINGVLMSGNLLTVALELENHALVGGHEIWLTQTLGHPEHLRAAEKLQRRRFTLVVDVINPPNHAPRLVLSEQVVFVGPAIGQAALNPACSDGLELRAARRSPSFAESGSPARRKPGSVRRSDDAGWSGVNAPDPAGRWPVCRWPGSG